MLPEYSTGRKDLTFKKKAYSGNLSYGARKRVMKSIDILLQKSPPEYIDTPLSFEDYSSLI